MYKVRRLTVGALAIAVLAVVAGTTFAQAAPSHTSTATAGVTAHQRAAFTASLPAGLRRQAHWYTLGHRRVWGVAMTMRMSRGGVVAHAAGAGYCGNPSGGELSCYQNKGSGLCMSSYGNAQGDTVNQYACNGSANQTWILGLGYAGQPYLEAYGSGNADLCLNNWGYGFSDGNRQALYSCNTAAASMWYLFGVADASLGSGWYLAHLYDGVSKWSNYCLTTLGNTTPGTPIEEWTCNPGSANQAFDGNPTPNNPGDQEGPAENEVGA
jgi:hypothetical protein